MIFLNRGVRFKIREVPNVIKAIRSTFGSKLGFRGELHGATLQEYTLILIGADQSKPQRAKTLLHEAIHVVLPSMSEQDVRRLEEGLYPLLRRCGFTYPSKLLEAGG